MKQKNVFSLLLCIAIGTGIGLLASKAWVEKTRIAQELSHSSYFEIPSEGGRYNLIFRAATPLDGQLLYLKLDGEFFAEVELPNSGSKTNYVNALAEDIYIPANAEGEICVIYDHSEMNLSAFSINPFEI